MYLNAWICVSLFVNLLIVAALCKPPTENLPFRYLTAIAHDNLHMDVLIECSKDKEDFYYKYMKRKGIFDYVCDIVNPEFKIEGIRLDKDHTYPLTITTDRITFVNFNKIIGQLISLESIINIKT